jgi:hypothetical protein
MLVEVQLAALQEGDIPGLTGALELVDGFDGALAHGFARLTEDGAAALTALAGAVAGTPLRDRVADAAGKVAAGSVTDEHLTALAGARAALFGAVHDALVARFDAATGRARASWAAPAGTPEEPLAGARGWLRELAIAGWRGVDNDMVSASGQVVQALLGDPRRRGLAVLLDGLAEELEASSPVATMPVVPERRWADLWTRAMLLSHNSAPAAPETVTGRLLVLGVDVHEHSTAVQVQVHGVLESAGASPRLVRTSVAAAKVDTITGPSVWRLFTGYPLLLKALAEHLSVEVTDLTLTPGGDLLWREDAVRPAEPADPFAVARLEAAVAPAVPPLDRHPVRIAEPVLIETYEVERDDAGGVAFKVGDARVAVDLDRLPSCGPLTPALVTGSSGCIGLMRWTGNRWTLQPLAVRTFVKKKPVEVHTGDWAQGPTDPAVVKAETKAGDAVAVLRERAGRLLRK